MSSSSSSRKKERDKAAEKSGKSKREKRYHESSGYATTPRAYDRRTDSHAAPEEEFSRLGIDSEQSEPQYPGEEAGSSTKRGKGKEKEVTWGSWSEYQWSPENSYWWRSRTSSLGKTEYDTFEGDQEAARSGINKDSTYLSEPEIAPTQHYTISTPIGNPSASEVNQSLDYQPGSPYYKPPGSSYTGTQTSIPITPSRGFQYTQIPNINPTEYEGQQHGSASSQQLPPIFMPPCNCCDPRENLCGILVIPKEPKPDDGKFTDKKHSSTKTPKRPGSSKVKVISSSNQISIQGPDGKNCGPLFLPGITPGPRPEIPRENASDQEVAEYWDLFNKWEQGHEEWKHITCPCGMGYFGADDGVWISGEDVRNGKPSNPLWRGSGGVAPSRISGGKFRGTLHGRHRGSS